MKRPTKKRTTLKKYPLKVNPSISLIARLRVLRQKKFRFRFGGVTPEISYLLVLVVIVTVFGVVVYVLTNSPTLPKVQEIGQTVALKKFVKPESFTDYVSSEGIKFAYPKEWGEVKKTQSDTEEYSFTKQKKTLRIRLTPNGFSAVNGIDGDCSKSLLFNSFDTISTFDWSANTSKGADYEILNRPLLTTESIHIDETFEHFSVFPIPGSCPGLRFNAYVALKNNPKYAGVTVLWFEYCPGLKTCGVETADEYTKYKADPTSVLSLGERNNLMLFFKSITE
jgi:hypothetical protein